MNLESLTKQQIILLTLLVSFVTSIATGIVTVTLIDQAPPGITRTVNRVVERTVEKIVPDSQGASVITKEKTIIVKEEDLITDLIKKGSDNIVRVFKRSTPKRLADKNNLYSEGTLIGVGTIISSDGTIVLDKNLIDKDNEYYIQTNNNKFFDIKEKYTSDNATFVDLINKDKTSEFSSIEVVSLNSLKLGQSVVVISVGKDKSVITGIISGFDKEAVIIPAGDEEKLVKTTEVISKINTNIIEKIPGGTPLFNLFGNVMAIALSSKNGVVDFIPAVKIKNEYNKFKDSKSIDSN